MLNAERIEAMTAEERRERLDALCQSFYGSDRYKAPFGRAIGVEPRTVVKWFAEGTPPVYALLLALHMITNRDLATKIHNIKTALQDADVL